MCTAKATHIFFSKKYQHICSSVNVNFNESLTNDVVSFEQLGQDFFTLSLRYIVDLVTFGRFLKDGGHKFSKFSC